ncbi:hypothetical protein DAEQUDRAFT_277662 [Daedalea quercina L-15889]|uniref:Uncharacterized protein n=1 Tax=Daedalea quercina L-15889 TaxID=1314783 RepID=A0A165Q846_9APHY|nr:hypothetical protein DAEQUDRAFT_277662 [Daedalea quercina L-15889]
MPFTLTIVTTSKPCKRTSGSDRKPIWPAPPAKFEDVRLGLVRTAYIQTSHLTWAQHDRVSLLRNLGESGKGSNVRGHFTEKEWLSIDKSKGRRRQRTSFTSSFNLACVPSFKFPTLSV